MRDLSPLTQFYYKVKKFFLKIKVQFQNRNVTSDFATAIMSVKTTTTTKNVLPSVTLLNKGKLDPSFTIIECPEFNELRYIQTHRNPYY